MAEYVAAARGVGGGLSAELRERVLDALGEATIPASGGLPRYVRESLVFPYAAGTKLVNRIQAGGGWAAIDRAFGDRPVLSSEQLMHPEKYERDERPVRVRVGDLRELLPQGARRLLRGDLGEFDSGQLLRAANGRARSERAAARLVGPGA